MLNLLDITRLYDFKTYYKLYLLGVENHAFGQTFLFFAKYGIVFFFLAFAYLISKKRIKAFYCSFLAMGIAGFVDIVISLFWNRPRPFISHAGMVDPIIEGLRVDNGSFPSSHTYIVFAVAVSVFLYGHKRLGVVLFILAILVALGRIVVGLHYPSDVLAGTLLGIASGIIASSIIYKLDMLNKNDKRFNHS